MFKNMKRLQTLAVFVAAAALLAGCGTEDESYTDSSIYGHDLLGTDFDSPRFREDYENQIDLPDGRKVAMAYREDKGLIEQHYDPDSKSWSKPHRIYSTKADPCQGVQLTESTGRVAAIADFGLYCYDGEPPMESLAVTADGSLQEWDVHMSPGIDGWRDVRITSKDTVEWKNSSYPVLKWSTADGFTGGFEGED
jgi:hypothetical protein